MKTAFHTVTALIPTGGSLEAALQFYTQSMGFRIIWQSGNMAGISRDGVGFNIIENSDPVWAANASFSIGVADLDALYQEYQGIPAKLGALEDKAWGRREFHLIAPSGVCFQFYQANE